MVFVRNQSPAVGECGCHGARFSALLADPALSCLEGHGQHINVSCHAQGPPDVWGVLVLGG